MNWKRKSVTSQNLHISNGQLVFLIAIRVTCYKQTLDLNLRSIKGSRSEITLPIVLTWHF